MLWLKEDQSKKIVRYFLTASNTVGGIYFWVQSSLSLTPVTKTFMGPLNQFAEYYGGIRLTMGYMVTGNNIILSFDSGTVGAIYSLISTEVNGVSWIQDKVDILTPTSIIRMRYIVTPAQFVIFRNNIKLITLTESTTSIGNNIIYIQTHL